LEWYPGALRSLVVPIVRRVSRPSVVISLRRTAPSLRTQTSTALLKLRAARGRNCDATTVSLSTAARRRRERRMSVVSRGLPWPIKVHAHFQGPPGFQRALNGIPPANAERTGRANCLTSPTSRTSSPASSPNRLRRTNTRHWIARAGSSQYACVSPIGSGSIVVPL
jgi:hypothetical protein